MTRTALLATLVCSLTVVACGGPSRFVSRGGMTVPASTPVQDALPLVMEAHSVQATEPRRAFLLLSQACEVGHSVEACIEAEAHDPVAGRPLIMHGCALGSAPACRILVTSEMAHEHKTEAAARADVDLALEMGCAQGVASACVTRSDLDGALVLGTQSTAKSSPGSETQNHRAVEVCVATCKAQRQTCNRQCELEGWETCPPTSECAEEERSCDMGCQANPTVTCAVDLRGACGPLT